MFRQVTSHIRKEAVMNFSRKCIQILTNSKEIPSWRSTQLTSSLKLKLYWIRRITQQQNKELIDLGIYIIPLAFSFNQSFCLENIKRRGSVEPIKEESQTRNILKNSKRSASSYSVHSILVFSKNSFLQKAKFMKIHLWLMISTRINKDLDQK